MSTNHTTNYNLNQWEATDKVLRILEQSPRWKPGLSGGRTIPVEVLLPLYSRRRP